MTGQLRLLRIASAIEAGWYSVNYAPVHCAGVVFLEEI